MIITCIVPFTLHVKLIEQVEEKVWYDSIVIKRKDSDIDRCIC